jgi:hypothetical protein
MLTTQEPHTPGSSRPRPAVSIAAQPRQAEQLSHPRHRLARRVQRRRERVERALAHHDVAPFTEDLASALLGAPTTAARRTGSSAPAATGTKRTVAARPRERQPRALTARPSWSLASTSVVRQPLPPRLRARQAMAADVRQRTASRNWRIRETSSARGRALLPLQRCATARIASGQPKPVAFNATTGSRPLLGHAHRPYR